MAASGQREDKLMSCQRLSMDLKEDGGPVEVGVDGESNSEEEEDERVEEEEELDLREDEQDDLLFLLLLLLCFSSARPGIDPIFAMF